MDKIVGNIICLIALFSCTLYADLSLDVLNTQGHKITRATAGEPFMVNVTVSNIDGDKEEPQIHGLQDFFVRRTGYRITTINGESSAQYSYQVRIDKPGRYMIGPASSDQTGKQSNAIRLIVGARKAISGASRRRGQKNETVLLRLKVDEDSAYVGQKIEAELRFFVPEEDRISIEQIVRDLPKEVAIVEKSGPKKQLYEIEGKRYAVYEWLFDIYAKTAGKIVIPAYFLDYTRELDVSNAFAGLSSLFGPRLERKRTYSNALTLNVLPLPQTDKHVDAVGKFQRYHATIDPAVAMQYEGMVLKLMIEGEGNLDDLPDPELLDMPQELKFYVSKRYINDTPLGRKKTFEYIVQGLGAGEYEIPSQEFTFFDVHANSYKTLSTAPLFVSIVDNQRALDTVPNQQDVAVHKQVANDRTSNGLAPLVQKPGSMHDGLWHKPLPLWLFIMLLCLPLFYVIRLWFWQRYARLMQWILPQYGKRRAFTQAQKQLASAYKHHRYQQLHHIFITLFALRAGCSPTAMNAERMDDLIAHTDWSDQNKKNWRAFLQRITQAAYAGSVDKEHMMRLFHDAAQWLQELQRVI